MTEATCALIPCPGGHLADKFGQLQGQRPGLQTVTNLECWQTVRASSRQPGRLRVSKAARGPGPVAGWATDGPGTVQVTEPELRLPIRPLHVFQVRYPGLTPAEPGPAPSVTAGPDSDESGSALARDRQAVRSPPASHRACVRPAAHKECSTAF